MDLKKKIRGFFTLNRRGDGGFTLVELIVVIAILAILAGVGIPVYSGYIKKANKQADITLANEAANALQTYFYANYTKDSSNDSGYVVLKYGKDADADDAFGGNAMAAVFGDNWRDTAVLKHDGWSFDRNLFSSMVSANGSYVAAVPGSSFTNNTQGLLEDVQFASSKLAEFMVKYGGTTLFAGEEGKNKLNLLLGGDAENNYLSVLDGYDKEITAQVLANATAFGIAATLKNETESQTVIDKFSKGDYITQFKSDETKLNDDSTLNDVAHTYAALEAYVAYVNVNGTDTEKTKVNAAFDLLNSTLGDPETTTGKGKVIEAINTCGKTIYSAAKYGSLAAYTDGPSAGDGEAYIGIMQTVNGLSGDYKNSLGEDGLFTSDALANRVDSFVAAAGDSADLSALAGIKEEILSKVGNDPALVIAFSTDANGVPGCSVLFLNAE